MVFFRTVSRTPGIHTTQERRLWDVVGGRQRGPWEWHPEAFFDPWRVRRIIKRTGDTPGIDQCPCLWRPRDWPACRGCWQKENRQCIPLINSKKRKDARDIHDSFQSFVNMTIPVIKRILNFSPNKHRNKIKIANILPC